jgi:hypothetical protein
MLRQLVNRTEEAAAGLSHTRSTVPRTLEAPYLAQLKNSSGDSKKSVLPNQNRESTFSKRSTPFNALHVRVKEAVEPLERIQLCNFSKVQEGGYQTYGLSDVASSTSAGSASTDANDVPSKVSPLGNPIPIKSAIVGYLRLSEYVTHIVHAHA